MIKSNICFLYSKNRSISLLPSSAPPPSSWLPWLSFGLVACAPSTGSRMPQRPCVRDNDDQPVDLRVSPWLSNKASPGRVMGWTVGFFNPTPGISASWASVDSYWLVYNKVIPMVVDTTNINERLEFVFFWVNRKPNVLRLGTPPHVGVRMTQPAPES